MSRRLLIILIPLTAIAVSGCAKWNWRGAGFNDNDEMHHFGEKLRGGSSGEGTGLDSKSREIERNLGYH